MRGKHVQCSIDLDLAALGRMPLNGRRMLMTAALTRLVNEWGDGPFCFSFRPGHVNQDWKTNLGRWTATLPGWV